MSSMSEKEAQDQVNRLRKIRATTACLICRGRKVRCDVAQHGPPCVNCKLDGFTCVAVARKYTNTNRNKRKRVEEDSAEPVASPTVVNDELPEPPASDAIPPSPPTAPRHVENEKTPFEAFCNLSAHDRSLQCKLTAALLYFDFQHIMRPDRVKNLEERTQYYCRRLDRLQGKERERAAVQLFQSSQAIQAASRALKVVDETVRYLENSIFFSQSASTFLPKDSPTSVSPPERTGPNDQDHWTSPAYQAGAASMQSSVIAAEATDDVSGLLDSDITPESSDESHRASAKSSLSPPDNTCSSTSTPATDALHIQHGSDILESVRDEAVTCLIDMGSNEDTGFPRMDVDGRASDEIERGWDLFMSFTSANDFLRS